MRTFSIVLGLLFLLACAPGPQAEGESSGLGRNAVEEPLFATVSDGSAPVGDPSAPLVIFLGDSLSAGYGVSEEEAFPQLLADRFLAAGMPFRLVNAGVSGDTSVGGLARLDWLLDQRPDVLVLELGGNDGLRGFELSVTEQSLRRIIERARAADCRVLLLGMQMPPSHGPAYVHDFAALYPRLAKETGVELVPFLLEGVGGSLELNQADGIHPTARGHRVLADNVEPYLRRLLDDL